MKRPSIGWSGLGLAAVLASCGEPASRETAPATRSAPPALEYVWDRERFPPAYDREAGRVALKGDAADDQRWAKPHLYAITVPPTGIAGLRAMAEWEPMSAIVMSYPDSLILASNATDTLVAVGKHASSVAEVWYLVTSAMSRDHLVDKLVQAGVEGDLIGTKVRLHLTSFGTVWLIDFGPLPILGDDGESFAFADFRYYHGRVEDDGVPTLLGRELPALGQPSQVTTYRMPVSTEGGTFQTTTDGICFTGTRQLFNQSCAEGGCDDTTGGRPSWTAPPGLLRPPLGEVQNHPQATKLREAWGAYLGCQDVVIMNSVTDDGTGHIDMFLKVVDDHTVVIGKYLAPFDAATRQEENAALLDENEALLEAYAKPDGTPFAVERLVMPGHRVVASGQAKEYVPFTYLNSTFINGLNLWPATAFPEWDASRAEAAGTWKAILPSYQHIWIDSTELSYWSGAIHCVTRTIPAKKAAPWVPDGECPIPCGNALCAAAEGGYAGECLPHDGTEPVCWGPAWRCDSNQCKADQPCLGTECQCIGFEGCCEAGSVKYCDDGKLITQGCTKGCGWSETKSWYDCGGKNGAVADQAEPSGAFPYACSVATAPCVPACEGKPCGDDGCGGACGQCAAGEACNDLGQCGPPCAPGQTCEEGACVDPTASEPVVAEADDAVPAAREASGEPGDASAEPTLGPELEPAVGGKPKRSCSDAGGRPHAGLVVLLVTLALLAARRRQAFWTAPGYRRMPGPQGGRPSGGKRSGRRHTVG
jgi:agmatine/peptidylarginine deiminase